MGTFVFDYGYGEGKEWYKNVENSNPANSALVVMLLAATGLETDAVLRVKTSFTDIVSGTTNEATNTGYARKVLTNVDLAAVPLPDTTNHWWQCTIPVQTWVAVTNDGTGAFGALIIGYRNAPGDPDTAIIPLTCSVFAITPNGGAVTATPSVNGFYRAGI